MSVIHHHAFDLRPGSKTISTVVMTLVGAAVALALTVFIVGSTTIENRGASNDSAATSALFGP